MIGDRAAQSWTLGTVFGLFFVGVGVCGAQEVVSDAAIIGFVDEQFEAYAERGGAASVLVVRHGRELVNRGYGLADKEADRRAAADTVYTVGSITKQFTGAAIAKLESAGKVRLDDTLADFFEDVPDEKAGITVEQLLSHSAGLPGSIGPDEARIGRDDFVALAFERPLEREPGEAYAYSNVGYSLLAAIIEKVSGKTYEEYLHETFFGPLEMSKTGYAIPEWDEDELAVGYRGERRWGTVIEHSWGENGPGWHLQGNGGIHSTTGDLYIWHKALLGGAILPARYAKKIADPLIPEGPPGMFYAYGWVSETTEDGRRFVHHDGGNGIFFADFWRMVEEDSVVIMLTNHYRKFRGAIRRKLAEMVFAPSP